MYEVGDTVPLTTLVKDAVGTPANAGSMNLAVTLPDGTAAPGIPNPLTGTAGAYSYPFAFTASGLHSITWTATGTNAGVYNDSIYIELQPIGIISLAEAKKHLRVVRTSDDDLIRDLIGAATSICESAEGTGRAWRRRTVTNEKHSAGGSILPNFRPVQSLTAITIDGAAGVAADYDVETWRITAASGTTIGTSGRRNQVLITYVAGDNLIPAAVRDGVKELVRHLYAMHRGGSNLPRQEEPDYTLQAGYLVPNRVMHAFRAFQVGL